jgi:phage minor structural protein
MATMLNVYDRATRKKTAVLQNAFDIVETQEINQIYSLSFTLPAEDEKNKYCLPRHYVRYGENGELYRIKSPKVNDTSVGTVVYECEHVITTLCDDIMFGSFIYGGMGVPTRETITWILSKQKTANWRLGQCAFARQFEYNWEQENLLNALYSIPKEFAASYMWTFDTTSYPWTINLVEIDKNATPEYYLRAKSNILASGTSADYANICTRIYPLGYGEGVNQLTIREATVDGAGNPVESGGTRYGLPYIQSPQSYINKYGIVEKVLVDRRFEQPNTLYGYAKSMLAIYQEPTMSRTFDVTDLYPITNKPLDDAQIGKICKLTKDDSIAYITKTVRQWDLAGDLHIDLSTKASDIASNVADLADRIRIESVYAQGATQLYQHSKDANATSDKGMNISLYFPSEMKQINKVMLKLELKRFRYYSSTTAGGGSINTSTGSGGYTSTSTASGGGTSTSTASGGGTTNTSVASGGGGISLTPSVSVTVSDTGLANWAKKANPYTDNAGVNIACNNAGDHSHTVYGNTNNTTPQSSENYRHYHAIDASTSYAATTGSHKHGVEADDHNHTIPRTNLQHNHPVSASVSVKVNNSASGQSGFSHSHTVNLPSHTHSFSVPSHTHTFSVPNHTHTIEVGDHTHTINPGIFESTESPTKFDIYVGGTKKTTIESTRYSDDITQWLLNDKNLIPRNSWINVEIRPDKMAYVVSSVFVQGFVQSRGGGNY